MNSTHKKALILGTGGASKAVFVALKHLDIDSVFVSRAKTENNFCYSDLNSEILKEYTIIINCSPIVLYLHNEKKPAIPYVYINHNNVLFDLIYNPEITEFLKEGMLRGAVIKNGYEMLIKQAEKAWQIWSE